MKTNKKHDRHYLALVSGVFLLLGFALSMNNVYAKASTKADQTKETVSAAKVDPGIHYPINLNTADAKTLSLIPGIGKSRAEAIITYRDENGAFKTVDDLAGVSGISSDFIEKHREYITVG